MEWKYLAKCMARPLRGNPVRTWIKKTLRKWYELCNDSGMTSATYAEETYDWYVMRRVGVMKLGLKSSCTAG